MTDALAAYEAFDSREPGCMKVELEPAALSGSPAGGSGARDHSPRSSASSASSFGVEPMIFSWRGAGMRERRPRIDFQIA